MRKPVENLTGRKFGKLTVIGLSHIVNRRRYWLYQCECGNTNIVFSGCLKSDKSKSCGCVKKTKVSGYESLWRTWTSMKARCRNKDKKHYSMKGITVCEEWKNDYMSFHNWALANGYKEGLTIERKDNSLGYYPQNCTWATLKEQSRNRTNSRFVSYNGQTKTVAEWAELYKVGHALILQRLNRGWSPDMAITTPAETKFISKHKKAS